MRTLALPALLSAPLLLAAAPAPKQGPPRLLVVASNKSGNWDIYVVQPATGEAKNLTDDKAVDYAPAWSPDGLRIAFVSDRDGAPGIWTMKPDGTDLKPLAKKQKATDLKWSPDGSRIVFTAPANNVDHIHTVDATTGKVTQLTDGAVPHRQPAWSPDGTRLSVSMYEGRYSTHTMTADGRDKEKLSDANGGLDAHWSSDGKKVVYVAYTAGPNGWKIYTVGADGKGHKQLTKSANTYGNVYPRWSPDGKLFSFGELDADGVLQVGVMSTEGGDIKVITKGPAQHVYTRWAPDGRSLSYTRNEAGKPASLVVSAPDGEDAKVVMTHVGGIAEWKPK
jgi:Tol biopolymer transport system component